MKKAGLPTYAELTQALGDTTLKLHPSQIHGLICGILCGQPNNAAIWTEWLKGEKITRKVAQLLKKLYEGSERQLKEFAFELQLLLPMDTEDLTARAEALTLWSQGFLTGLKLVNVPIVSREPSEATEAINDLIEIAKMNYEEVVANEEDEAAYMELVEYVRMAAILIYQDKREPEVEKKIAPSAKYLH